MESITIKVENGFAKEIEKEMKPYYSTKTEFIREAIRDKIKVIKEERYNEQLRTHFGKAGIKTSFEEERKIREAISKKFAKKFNVKL